MITIHEKVGLAGVSESEHPIARKWGRIFDYASLLLVLLLAFQWELDRRGQITTDASVAINWLVWLFFICRTSVLGLLCKDRKAYLSSNWLNFVIIFLGLGFLWNSPLIINFLQNIRPLLIVALLIPWPNSFINSLSDNRLSTTLVSALFTIILAGVIISGIDPGIPTAWDGIWWAAVTMSTVGYGDIVPVGGVGRFFSIILILMGLAFFSVITANFAALFIHREVKEGFDEVRRESEEIREVIENLQDIKYQEKSMQFFIKDIQERLVQIEKRLDDKK